MVDNCVAVPNADQMNGNELAERANHADKVWGDACDPVPHAKPEAQTREANTSCVTVNDPPIPPSQVPPGTTHQECTGTVQQDEIVGQTVAPHRADATSNIGFPVQVAETRERYCQKRVPDFTCDRFDTINDAELTAWGDADLERGNDPGRPWHRVTTRPPLAPAFFAQRDRLLANWTYGVTQARVRWEFTTDFPFWTADPNNFKIPLSLFCSTIDCLNGAYWFRTLTPIGDSDPKVGSTVVGLHGDNLANAYGAIRPEAFGIRYCPAIPRGLENVQGSSLPIQAPSSPGKLPIIVWPLSTEGVAFANGIHRDADVLVPTGTGVVGVLQSSGAAIVAGSVPNCGPAIASDGLSQLAFDPSVTWTNALEPIAVGGGPDALAVASDGTSLRAEATLGTDALTSTLIDCATTGTCGSSASTPPARTGFSAVYSRTLGGVLVAGGSSSSSNLQDVWFLSPGAAPVDVTPMTLGATACASCGEVLSIGKIRAVTYSFADQKLWLVDEVTQGKLTFQRISRAPLHGSLEVLAVFPKLGIFDRTFLTLDRDGRVLATLARTGLPGFVTARLEVTSFGLRVTGVTRIPGAELLGPPITSARSYGFVVRQGKTVSIQRRSNLLTLPPCAFHEGI